MKQLLYLRNLLIKEFEDKFFTDDLNYDNYMTVREQLVDLKRGLDSNVEIFRVICEKIEANYIDYIDKIKNPQSKESQIEKNKNMYLSFMKSFFDNKSKETLFFLDK